MNAVRLMTLLLVSAQLATTIPRKQRPNSFLHFASPVIPSKVNYVSPQIHSAPSEPCQRELKCECVVLYKIIIIFNEEKKIIVIMINSFLERCHATIGRNDPDSGECQERYGR
jgi:hypothetical protein